MSFTRIGRAAATLSLLSVLVPSTALAVDYDVGPGQALAAISDVPWESLAPGDRVLIHWRDTPYREKWVIGRAGTELDPIVISGVPGPGGELPVISGDGATTPSALNFTNEDRGVIKIGSSNSPPDTLPEFIVIENLEVRSGRPAFQFTDDGGSTQSYSSNAASIYVEKAANLTIRNCVLTDSGNGLFMGVFDGATQNILVEGNYLYGNGIVGSAFQHNSYTAAIGIIFQHNHYGPLRDGCDGNNLKDRSAGLVVRYNWLEGGNRQLDLVDGEDSPSVVNHPSYRETFVYGNMILEPMNDGNGQLIHYGGDSGTESDYRKGTLYLFNNTIVSGRSSNTTLVRLSTNEESADVRNNIIRVTSGGDRLALMSNHGVLALSHNWMEPGWRDSFEGGFDGSVTDDGTSVGGNIDFESEGGQDFRLTSTSDCIDAGTTLHSAAAIDHIPQRHYIPHQSDDFRTSDGTLDVGAYEYCEGATCNVVGSGGTGAGGQGGAGAGGAGSSGGSGGTGSGTGGSSTGSGGSSTGANGGAGNGGSGGAQAQASSSSSDDGGCGCHTGGSNPSSGWLALSLGLLGFSRRRR